MNDKRYMLRHILGAIAYRLQKALRDAHLALLIFVQDQVSAYLISWGSGDTVLNSWCGMNWASELSE